MTEEINKTLTYVGSRIALSHYIGTVKYVGPVHGTSGTWLGVEWDDPSRGKHDGVKEGKQYFKCSIPGSGSFIRPSLVNIGKSFLQALKSKYIEDAYIDPHEKMKETVILGSSNGAIEVEVVGLNRIRAKLAQLLDLRQASLETEFVASSDPTEQIKTTCPNLRRLDISRNLLTSWESVATIAKGLTVLETLLLNRFVPLSDTSFISTAFGALEELHINSTRVPWDDVMSLIAAMPNLKCLEAGYNDFRDLKLEKTPSVMLMSKLETLNLDGNSVEEWLNVVAGVCFLPKLKRLILTSNKILAIPFEQRHSIQNIHHLGLSGNGLNAWSDIDALNLYMPELATLNIVENPLTTSHQDFRPLIIARLPSLVSLNAATISAKERIDSELFYLSKIVREGQVNDTIRSRRHPQWTRLCEKFGRPDIAVVEEGKNTLERRLIVVKINVVESLPPDDTKLHVGFRSSLAHPTELRILPTMTMRMFCLKALKTFATSKYARQSVQFWRWLNDCYTMIEDDETKELDWLGIENGSELLAYIS